MIKINSPSDFGILADTDNKPEIINIIKNFKNDNLRRKSIRRIIKLEDSKELAIMLLNGAEEF